MNKKQWITLGIIFLFLGISFISMGSLADEDAFFDRAPLIEPSEGRWIVMNNYSIGGEWFRAIGSSFIMFGVGFIICGFMEKKNGI